MKQKIVITIIFVLISGLSVYFNFVKAPNISFEGTTIHNYNCTESSDAGCNQCGDGSAEQSGQCCLNKYYGFPIIYRNNGSCVKSFSPIALGLDAGFIALITGIYLYMLYKLTRR